MIIIENRPHQPAPPFDNKRLHGGNQRRLRVPQPIQGAFDAIRQGGGRLEDSLGAGAGDIEAAAAHFTVASGGIMRQPRGRLQAGGGANRIDQSVDGDLDPGSHVVFTETVLTSLRGSYIG
ncbi:hypothetical protein ACFWF3_16700, partial [Nocardia sp. NPDC060220]|uniref:hypothetical protein n=1 Tax=Nocardia sp. NPDC060220 TaxID=3347076 RepID=UPI003669DCB3